jgi:hypothetical protein
MFTSGKITYEVGGYLEATPYGGLAAMHRLVTKLGLVDAINERVRLLKIHLPYHESDHVLNMAYNVLTGGTRLEDIERLRHDVAYMNAVGADLIPDPTTAGDFCRRFAEDDVVSLMDAVNAAPAGALARPGPGPARARGLRRCGWHDRAHQRVAQAGHGHLLQGDLGLRTADRHAGQHPGGAVPGQPARQRPQPL